jgi:hypothetical protein
MPVTTRPAQHGANLLRREEIIEGTSPIQLLEQSCNQAYARCDLLVQSTFSDLEEATDSSDSSSNHLYGASANGFVFGAIKAYNEHLHLKLRPDDIWLAILTQLKIYINEHAEELRGRFFPSHKDGQINLEVDIRDLRDFGEFALEIARLTEKVLVDPGIREWITPKFSTTTPTDEAVYAMVMMGAFQKYIRYVAYGECGLPSVTLLGDKSDWEDLERRLETIPYLGEEPKTWYGLLKPICTRFVRTFDEPEAADTKEFWQSILNSYNDYDELTYETKSYYNGWITAFCFWGEYSKCQYNIPKYGEGKNRVLCLDGAQYGQIESNCVPDGWMSVPITRRYMKKEWPMTLVAGSVAMEFSGSETPTASGVVGLDTIQPRSGWWAYNDRKDQEPEARVHEFGESYHLPLEWPHKLPADSEEVRG